MPTAIYSVPRSQSAAFRTKRILARALRAQLEQTNESIQSLARRMGTGRTSIRRLLDEHNTSITLATMIKAADAVGLELALTTRPLRPAELKRLATRLPATTGRAASQLEDEIVTGFYGRKTHA